MKMKMLMGLGLILSLGVFCAFAVAPLPESVRAVQCGACMTQSEADVLALRLENLGYGPVWIRNEGDYIRVFAGIYQDESTLDQYRQFLDNKTYQLPDTLKSNDYSFFSEFYSEPE